MEETEFRKRVQEVIVAIEKSFGEIDPDVAECEQLHGALTIIFPDGSRCILSAQPSVRQIWLALAAEGTAYHFDYDRGAAQWKDDKGKGLDLRSFLQGYLHKKTGVEIKW